MPLIKASQNEDKKAVTIRLPESLIDEMGNYCKVFNILKSGKPDLCHFISEGIKKNVLDKEKDKLWIDFKNNQEQGAL